MLNKMRRKWFQLATLAWQWPRVQLYRAMCRNRPAEDRAKRHQPVLLLGDGEIRLGACQLGIWPSPYFLNGYVHIEARSASARVDIADGVSINNNAVIMADRTSISIGRNTLIGTEFTVYDSDFHDLHPDRRLAGIPVAAPVSIGENVFIGSRVTVLKGVTIGRNSVVANGSVVAKDVPENTIVAGVPAKVVAEMDEWRSTSS